MAKQLYVFRFGRGNKVCFSTKLEYCCNERHNLYYKENCLIQQRREMLLQNYNLARIRLGMTSVERRLSMTMSVAFPWKIQYFRRTPSLLNPTCGKVINFRQTLESLQMWPLFKYSTSRHSRSSFSNPFAPVVWVYSAADCSPSPI